MQALLRSQLRREAFESLRAVHDRLPAEERTPEPEQEMVDTVRGVPARHRQRNAN